MEKKNQVFDKVSPNLLEAMPYQYEGKEIDVNISSEEFTCLCPWTGLPDFAFVEIIYTPQKLVVELKSLKLYLQSYRMVGMVHESVVNNITEDLVKLVKPARMTVSLDFGLRGGIRTQVRRQYSCGDDGNV